MKTINDLLDAVLLKEGGYVNHSADRGGPTNFGITIKTYEKWIGYKLKASDVKKMHIDEARAIYLKNYFKRPKLGMLPVEVQGQVFDCAVNHGPKRAIKLLQKTLNNIGYGTLVVDGKLGPFSKAACERAQKNLGSQLTNNLVNCRVQFYKRIVQKTPTQMVFLKGWLRRANEFRIENEVMHQTC